MKRDNVNYLVVGVFVIATGVALMVFLYQITGKRGPTEAYHVHYRNVSGLKYGTGVSYEGYRVGQVERIEPLPGDDGMRYRVSLSVVEGWRIPEDSLARIVTSGLISAVSIDIAEGEARTFLAPGSEIAGREQGNIFAALNDVAADFKTLSNEGIRPVLTNFNARLDELSAELTDLSRSSLRPLMSSLQSKVEATEEIRTQLRSFLERMDDNAQRLQRILSEENQAHIGGFLRNVEGVSVDLQGLVGRIEETRQQLNGVLDGLDTLVAHNREGVTVTVEDLQAAVADMRRSMRVVSENIDGIMHNLDASSRNVNELTREVRQNPGLLLRSAPQREPGEP